MDIGMLQQFVGTNTVQSYAVLILIEILPSVANLIPIFLSLVAFICNILGSLFLSKFGRKTALQIGTVIIILALTLICIGYFLDSE